jgi:hypothetical protein
MNVVYRLVLVLNSGKKLFRCGILEYTGRFRAPLIIHSTLDTADNDGNALRLMYIPSQNKYIFVNTLKPEIASNVESANQC